jgi:phage FluMu protein Com
MSEQVKCRRCGRRLFDKDDDTEGIISIKCPVCKNISSIRLKRGVKKSPKSDYAIPSKGVRHATGSINR